VVDRHSSGAPVILLLHAVRADRTMMISRARLFQRHGFSTLLIDLQAHGETPGTAITFGKRESDDVVAAIAWIKNRAPNRKVGIVGCSMGGAATLLAPQPLGVDAVVLESVYPRIGLAVENRVRLRLGPLAPLVTPMLFWQLRSRLHLEPEELEPIRSIGQLGAPVLIAAGSDNQHTTLSETKALYVAAREPKELWILTGAKHQDLLHFDTSGYEAHVLRFLTQHLRETLPEPQKLNKAEVERLVEEHTAENKPLVFASYQGARRCCDLGDPNLPFVPQNHVIEFGDGFVPWRAGLSYEIAEDGTIRLGVSDDRETAGMNEKVGLNAVKIYRYGDALYLVRAAEVDPDLSFDPGTLWPFKATTELTGPA
jgi:alpha-beta hydrolase superfamily lysophospholipase